MRRTSVVKIDSTKANPEGLRLLEQILYGTARTDPRLPLPDEVIAIMDHDESWIGGVYPYLDSISYPFDGSYEQHVIGLFSKLDERKFKL